MRQILLTFCILFFLITAVSAQEVAWIKDPKANRTYHLTGLPGKEVTVAWKSSNEVVHLKLTVNKEERSYQLVDAVELARVQYEVFDGSRAQRLGKVTSNFGGNKIRVDWVDGVQPSVINLKEAESDQVFPDGFSIKSTYSSSGYTMPALLERSESSYLANAALLLFLHTEKKRQTEINKDSIPTSLLLLVSGK